MNSTAHKKSPRPADDRTGHSAEAAHHETHAAARHPRETRTEASAERHAAVFYSSPLLTLVCLPPARLVHYSIEAAAALSSVHPEMLRYYCRLGLLDAHVVWAEGAPFLAADALDEIARIEHYRRYLGVQRRALPLLCQLQREAERLHLRLRFLRLE